MSRAFRRKLIVVAAVLITLITGSVGSYVRAQLEASLLRQTQAELYRHAKTTGAILETLPAATALDAVADRVATATGIDVAIFDPRGRRLGDSSRAPLELEQLVGPADDPELLMALDGGSGVAVRPEDSDGGSTMFVAVQVASPRGVLVSRVAAPVALADEVVRSLWQAMLASVGLGLALAVGMLLAVGSKVERTLQPVVSTAAAAVQTSEDEFAEDSEGGPQSLRSVAVDLERTMGTLSSERNRFQAVLQTMEQAVVVLGPDQRLTTVNRAAGALFSMPEKPQGRTLLEAVRVPRLKRLAELVAQGGVHRDEFELPGGRRVDVRATPHGDRGVLLIAQDVTEIRRLERVRRDFVANVSHELRTPISVVKANTETLLDGGLEDAKMSRMFVEAIHRHADRLGRIVSDLLDISRIEAGRYPLAPARLNVGEVVDHVLDLVEVDARRKHIDVSVNVGPELEVYADRKAMEHILINLASNAFKYTPEHGSVEVTAHGVDDGKVRIEVLDDGPGIDPSHRERIFERFFRADAGRSRDMGGTGLGLSIVKHLVDAHDGEVGVDPRSPRGSVFWFAVADGSASDPAVKTG